MISRNTKFAKNNSFFLFGPRGTGKSYWLHQIYPDAIYIDLLNNDTFLALSASPERLSSYIPDNFSGKVIIDEIQKVPALLDVVHRLIENFGYTFILTGSSARKLRKAGVNLLGGRAYIYHFYPLTALELGSLYDFPKALKYGLLPTLYDDEKTAIPDDYLRSYVAAYLKEEVIQEGLTRNLPAFTRFLEAASFSQGEVLNVSEIARECSIERKLVENYFTILEDLLIAIRIPVFTKKSKRRLISHSKFYYFDTGIYRAIRPKGPLDLPEQIDGAALETLLLQELRANISNFNLKYDVYFWRTTYGTEVDFVLYGEDGFIAIEIKRKRNITCKDLSGLKSFNKDYPSAKRYVFCGVSEKRFIDNIEIWPVEHALRNLDKIVTNNN
jgi:predicted AAA+ superfamily ATPase